LARNLFESIEPKEDIVSLINYLCELIAARNDFIIPKELRKQAMLYAITHYKKHTDAYTVKVNGVDPYKIFSWVGLYFYDESLKKYGTDVADAFLKTTILAMNRSLWEEGKQLPPLYLKKIYKMVKSDFNGKASIGIGKNGLYLAFRSASLCEIRSTSYEILESTELED